MKLGVQLLRPLPYSFLLAVSLYATAFWLPSRTVEPEDWKRVEEALRREFQTADAIVLCPWWLGRAREYLGDLPIFQYRRAEQEDWSYFRRLWVLELDGYRLGGPFADGTFRQESEQSFGELTLRRFLRGEPVAVAYDFRRELERARVDVLSPSGPRPCSEWRGDRWQCSPREWNYIGRAILELGDDPREVIWAHPVDDPTRVSYPQVPGGRELLLYTGFTPAAVRARDGAPVTVRVFVNERLIGQAVQKNENGFFRHRFDISGLGPGPYGVSFDISTPNAGMRHFAFTAEVRR